MGANWKLSMVSTVLWTMAAAFMVGGTFRQSVIVMAWGGFTALAACMVTGWLVALCAATKAAHNERLELEHLAEIMARCEEDESLVSRLH